MCAAPLTESGLWVNEFWQAQLQALFGWLANGGVPALVSGHPDVCPVILAGEHDNRRILSLINVSTGGADSLHLDIAAPSGAKRCQAKWMDDAGVLKMIPAALFTARKGGWRIKLMGPAIPGPSQVRLIILDFA